MRYWDSSALVRSLLPEPSTGIVRRWLAEDGHVATWVWTRPEIIGAIERRLRQGSLSREGLRATRHRLDSLASQWDEITDVLAVRSQAELLLARHPLRAADAGQLGAALLVQSQISDRLTFVCLDQNLSLAAEREGLRVLDAGD